MTFAPLRRALAGAAAAAALAIPLLAAAPPAQAYWVHHRFRRPGPVVVAPPVVVARPRVFAHAPAPYPRAVWVPAHWDRWGRWRPGHWR